MRLPVPSYSGGGDGDRGLFVGSGWSAKLFCDLVNTKDDHVGIKLLARMVDVKAVGSPGLTFSFRKPQRR